MSYVHKHDLPSPEEAQARYPHGTRARYYLGKCKCFPCRLANSDYEAARSEARRPPWTTRRVERATEAKRDRDAQGRVLCRFCEAPRTPRGITRHERACTKNPTPNAPFGWIVVHRKTGEQRGPFYATCPEVRAACVALNKRNTPKPPNEYVSCAPVRKHLKRLQKQGIGVKSVHVACGVSASVLDRMLRGMIKRTRRGTAEKILAVDVMAAARGRAKIDGAATWKLLDDLLARGFTKSWIASQLAGRKVAALQLNRDVVSGENAQKVRALHARLEGQFPPARRGRWKFTPPVQPKRVAPNPLGRNQHASADKPQSVPLSKRDPAIKKRWDDLFRAY